MSNCYKVMEVVESRLEWCFNKKGYDTYKEAEDALFDYCIDNDNKFGQYVIVYFKDDENRPRYSVRKTYIVGLYFLRDGIAQMIFNRRKILGPISDRLSLTNDILENERKQEGNSVLKVNQR